MRNKELSNKDRLIHILNAIDEIQDITKDESKESYLSNRVLIGATLYQFAIIGEAVIYIDDEILAKYSYPWHEVRAFRNFILHEYHAIDFKTIWEAVNKDLPELKRIIGIILTNEFN
jgi:uncharacterized protein with HEPN domain